MRFGPSFCFFLAAMLFPVLGFAAESAIRVGVARIDITPDYPIRLSGYGNRTKESEGVAQKLWAKALAIETEKGKPTLIVTVDNCGVPAWIREELAKRLKKQIVSEERLAICSSHTHSAPCLKGVLPNLFSADIIPSEQAHIDGYSNELVDKLEKLTSNALSDLKPGKLAWGEGRVEFARNRRPQSGPVDHAFPVLKATDMDGHVRAILVNYACHCTTLGGGEFNQVYGDWAGCAQEAIERENPGAIALISIGCGADANPYPRGKIENAKAHGEEVAAEVKTLFGQHFTPITSKLVCRIKHFDLPFDPLPTREEWEKRAKEPGIVGYHAKKNLARLDKGEKLPTTLPYIAQVWNFGDDLAMVFLAGEVVVDYSLRLKHEFDSKRLWVNGYANDVPCYIPSRRILKEGGYEAETSLWYYDRPARLSAQSEDLIVNAVHDLMPKSFRADPKKAEFPDPLSPEKALGTFRTAPDLTIDIAAAEPLVESPVAIDWGADGRLWVIEMLDYPAGLDGNWKAGGRVKVLEDTNRDGRYDKATVFLDGLPFPTGLLVLPKGVLICAAPNIVYAEDSNGDGKADVVRTNFTGFATHNYQARVNGLSCGLDGWIYGSSALFGGKIKNQITGDEVDLSGRDFRINPATWKIEPASGLSQQGRIRDDFGNWFGNDNSTLLWHYPLPEHYMRRNPHVNYPSPRVNVAALGSSNPNQLFPISPTLERFNDPQAANHTTSACGPEIYRDSFLGDEYYGNAFICEPVHNLVTRLILEPKGATFAGHRAQTETSGEFLASADNWFRPVQVRTGPDGALWVVDMYRFVIEHPRWIPPDRLKQLDVRAGADKGRIYRIYPKQKQPLALPQPVDLVSRLDSSSGTRRDIAAAELLHQTSAEKKPAVAAELTRLFDGSSNAAVRVQVLSVLNQLQQLSPKLLARALNDTNRGVRIEAIRASENSKHPEILEAALPNLVKDDASVRFQLALSLGELGSAPAANALADLAKSDDSWLTAAVLSSAPKHLAKLIPKASGRLLGPLCETAIGLGRQDELIAALCNLESGNQLFLSLLDAFERKGVDWQKYLGRDCGKVLAEKINHAMDEARRTSSADAVQLLGRQKDHLREDVELLSRSLSDPAVREAAFQRLSRIKRLEVASSLLAKWASYSPSARSKIINLLSSRQEWLEQLLTAVEKGNVSKIEFSADQRQRLLKQEDAALREKAERLLPVASQRKEVLAKYESTVSLRPDPAHGAGVFEKTCATCHLYRGHGNDLGPNLAEFEGKSVSDFVVAILDPNAAVDPKFVTYNVETTDGRNLTGVVKDETASSITVVQAGGIRETLSRSDVKQMDASQLSLMPEGLEQGLSPQDLADLIGWIKQSEPNASSK